MDDFGTGSNSIGDKDYHGDGWFKNICWNEKSKNRDNIHNNALKNWALATTWQYLEVEAKRESLIYEKSFNFRRS